jgi:hypothetical protein
MGCEAHNLLCQLARQEKGGSKRRSVFVSMHVCVYKIRARLHSLSPDRQLGSLPSAPSACPSACPSSLSCFAQMREAASSLTGSHMAGSTKTSRPWDLPAEEQCVRGESEWGGEGGERLERDCA